jgi:hypothetical protein
MTTAYVGWWWLKRRVQWPTSNVSAGRGALATEVRWPNRPLAHQACPLEPVAVGCP